MPGADFYYTAYRDLGTCRPADGPIPWDKAMAYAERKRLKPDLADALWTVVSRMDTAERRWRLEQMEREAQG